MLVNGCRGGLGSQAPHQPREVLHAQRLGVVSVQGVLGIHEGGGAPPLLRLRQQSRSGFPVHPMEAVARGAVLGMSLLLTTCFKSVAGTVEAIP